MNFRYKLFEFIESNQSNKQRFNTSFNNDKKNEGTINDNFNKSDEELFGLLIKEIDSYSNSLKIKADEM